MRKLFAFDIDGTLMPEGKEILKSSIDAINMINDHGDIAILATGRSYDQTLPIAEILGIKRYLICVSGLVYVDLVNKEIKPVTSIDLKIVNYFFELAKKLKRQLNIKLEQKAIKYYFGSSPENDIDSNSSFWKKGGTLHPIYNKISNFFKEVDFKNIIQISIKAEQEKINEVYESVLKDIEEINPDYSVRIISDVYLEINIKKYNKALMIDQIRQQEDIDINDVYVFGDSNNDLEMVDFFSHGIAMGNSNEELKKIASEIIDNCEDNGVFKYISKIYQE